MLSLVLNKKITQQIGYTKSFHKQFFESLKLQ